MLLKKKSNNKKAMLERFKQSGVKHELVRELDKKILKIKKKNISVLSSI